VIAPRHQPISEDTRELIDRLLLEKISLAGIVRATGVSPRWLQYYRPLAKVPNKGNSEVIERKN
jgi:hypothetical protein